MDNTYIEETQSEEFINFLKSIGITSTKKSKDRIIKLAKSYAKLTPEQKMCATYKLRNV